MKSIAKQFGAFLALGGMSACVTVGGPALLHEVGHVPVNIAYRSALIAAIFLNFFMMRHVIMPTDDPRWGRQLIAFALSSVIWRGMEYASFEFLHARFAIHYTLLIVGIAGFFTVLKFVYYRLTVFAPKRPSAVVDSP
jgi:putative flippase GtrA